MMMMIKCSKLLLFLLVAPLQARTSERCGAG